MRATRVLLGCGVVASAAACAATGPDDPPVPVGNLHGARPAPDGDTVWVIGGTVVSDEVWAEMTTPSVDLSSEAEEARERGSNELLLQYAPDGTLLQAVDVSHLDLGTGLYGNLLGPTAASSSTGSVITASPSIVIAVSDGEASLLPPGPFDGAERVANLLRAVGSVGDEVLVAAGERGGIGLPETGIDLMAVDPATGDVREISLPSGVAHTTSVCVRDDRLLVAAASSVERLAPGEIGVWEVDPSTSEASLVVSAPASVPFAGSIDLVCTAGGTWLVEQNTIGSWSSGTATTSRRVDLDSGDIGEPFTAASTMQVVPQAPSDAGDLVLSDGSEVEGAERRPRRWADGRMGEPADVSDEYFVAESHLVTIGDRLYDVRPLLAHPPGGDADPAVAVDLPRVS